MCQIKKKTLILVLSVSIELCKLWKDQYLNVLIYFYFQ